MLGNGFEFSGKHWWAFIFD